MTGTASLCARVSRPDLLIHVNELVRVQQGPTKPDKRFLFRTDGVHECECVLQLGRTGGSAERQEKRLADLLTLIRTRLGANAISKMDGFPVHEIAVVHREC